MTLCFCLACLVVSQILCFENIDILERYPMTAVPYSHRMGFHEAQHANHVHQMLYVTIPHVLFEMLVSISFYVSIN